MNFKETPFKDLWIIEPVVYKDDRGNFFESFNESMFRSTGIETEFVQDNQSISRLNVIRGLHFQRPPHEQGKLVRVIHGAVIDVVVDIRLSSPTFGKHFSIRLDDQNNLMLWIPGGFAHGFSVLKDHSIFHYKVDRYYHPASEAGIIYNDPELNIDWKVSSPVISSKDRVLPSFKEFKLSEAL